MPGGAARSGNPLLTQASATSGVDKSANVFKMMFSLDACGRRYAASAPIVLNDSATGRGGSRWARSFWITVSLAGRPLFGELGTRFQLERTRVLDSPFATHIKFRVLK
jgi:hypothetical protein